MSSYNNNKNNQEQPQLPPPLLQEQNVDEKEQKRMRNREYKRKSRTKQKWKKIEERASSASGIKFEEREIEFIVSQPTEGKVTDPIIWETGILKTPPMDLSKDTSRNDMTNGVIVQPKNDPNNRVAIPQGHIKEIKMVQYILPQQTNGTPVVQYVGGRMADNDIVYSLIKWGDKEFHWVPLDHIHEVEEKRQSKRTKRLGHDDNETSKITGNQGPPDIVNVQHQALLKTMYEKAENEINDSNSCDGRIDVTSIRLTNGPTGPKEQKGKHDFNLLLQSNLLLQTLRGRISGKLPAISLLAGAADPSKPLEPEEYPRTLVALAPTRDNRITKLGYRATFDNLIEGIIQPIKEEEKEQKNNKTPECSEEGCTTKAHGNTQFKYCLKHNPNPKMCDSCNQRQARRKGGLCDPCFSKTPMDDSVLYCQGCFTLGFKRKPRKVGGFCATCIQVNNGKKLLCKQCNRRPRFMQQLCYSCFKKGEEGDK